MKNLSKILLGLLVLFQTLGSNLSIIPPIYADTDSRGNSITKYIQSETSTGVTFGIDWIAT